MNFYTDCHTHSIASGHAYSTIQEMIDTAREKGLTVLGITEHGPKMPGSCSGIYFSNLKVIPRSYKNLTLLLGIEANILDEEGHIDVSEKFIGSLDHIVASLHTPCIRPGDMEYNTNAVIHTMERNPHVSIIGHPDDSGFPLDYERLVTAAKKYNVLLEVNNSSLSPTSFRQNARENYKTMLSYCREMDVPVIVDSDAHICNDVGNTSNAAPLLDDIDFPERLVMNTDPDRLLEFFKKRSPLVH